MRNVKLCYPKQIALGEVMLLEKGNERIPIEKKNVFKLRKANFKKEICVTTLKNIFTHWAIFGAAHYDNSTNSKYQPIAIGLLIRWENKHIGMSWEKDTGVEILNVNASQNMWSMCNIIPEH